MMVLISPSIGRPDYEIIEPAFDAGGEFWPTLSDVPHMDIRALENTIAKQSAELNLRLLEIIELYNVQQQRANELQIACEEIDRETNVASALEQVEFLNLELATAAAERFKLVAAV
jgi:hypothetical protein